MHKGREMLVIESESPRESENFGSLVEGGDRDDRWRGGVELMGILFIHIFVSSLFFC